MHFTICTDITCIKCGDKAVDISVSDAYMNALLQSNYDSTFSGPIQDGNVQLKLQLSKDIMEKDNYVQERSTAVELVWKTTGTSNAYAWFCMLVCTCMLN